MDKKYIHQNKTSFNIVKNSKNYGKFRDIDDAIFIRDELVNNDWDLDTIDEIYQINGSYIVVKVIDEKIHILSQFNQKPSPETIDKLVKKYIRNPNNSRYGLNITRVFDTFVIKKRMAGDDYIFGYYDNLEDAEFVRNFLLDNNWNVGEFSQIEYDSETNTYRAIEVIDDKVYVLKSSKTQINITEAHKDFLNKISKHKLGLANYTYLDELTGKISELKERFGVEVNDENWNLTNTTNPLNDIIFNLTPFQQAVFDAVDNSTFDEIKQKLIRYKSKNFEVKIQKNLDELIELGLIDFDGDSYRKIN